jgi:hypothetical protein
MGPGPMLLDLLNCANAWARIFGTKEGYKSVERPLWHTAALIVGLVPFGVPNFANMVPLSRGIDGQPI